MILVAGLLAGASALLVARPAGARRLRGVVPQRTEVASAAAPGREMPRTIIFVLTGLVAWWAFRGVVGVGVGLGVGLGGPWLVSRLDDTEDDSDELAARLPLALDLLGACLAGGGILHDAVEAVARATPGPCGERLGRVAAALTVGAPAEEAFRALGDDRGAGGAAARALSRAAEGGTPVAAAVSRVAEESRRAAAVAARKKAKRAGVMAVGPLGACFLPAFVALGVVPLVVGLATPLLKTL